MVSFPKSPTKFFLFGSLLRYHCGIRLAAPRLPLFNNPLLCHNFDDDDNDGSVSSSSSDDAIETLAETSPLSVPDRLPANEAERQGLEPTHNDTIEELEAFKTIHIQTTAPGIVNSSLLSNVPLPRFCGARFSGTRLVCFFPFPAHADMVFNLLHKLLSSNGFDISNDKWSGRSDALDRKNIISIYSDLTD
jgi:hypothetical protein